MAVKSKKLKPVLTFTIKKNKASKNKLGFMVGEIVLERRDCYHKGKKLCVAVFSAKFTAPITCSLVGVNG